MEKFDNRNQYAELLALLAACDKAHMVEGETNVTQNLEMEQTSEAVASYLERFGIEYCDFDDAHFFATCALIRELQAARPSVGGVQ